MNATTLRLTLAIAAAAVITACGGGSGNSTPTPIVANPAIGTLTATQNGSTQLTLTIFTGDAAAAAAAAARRKTPQYVSGITHGLQATISGNGTSAVYAFSTTGTQCTTVNPYTRTCTFLFPTVATTETISILELSQAPTGTVDPATGIASGPFPANSDILATGSATTTLTPGAVTQLAIGLNPIVAGLFDDCGTFQSSTSISSNGTTRIVVTGNAVTRSTILVDTRDDGGSTIKQPVVSPNASPIGQPFVDVNGSPEPISGTSSSTHFGILPLIAPVNSFPSAPPTGAYAATAAVANSGSLNFGGVVVAIQYDGNATPSPTIQTLTFDNQLSATLPVFTGSPVMPVAPANYHTSLVYTLAPMFATPASFTVATGGVQTVTGYAPGATSNMVPSTCVSSGMVTLGSFGPAVGTPASGMQTFVFTANGTPGTCTFTLKDGVTHVLSNAVTVTVTP
jgi:hypothetical protein